MNVICEHPLSLGIDGNKFSCLNQSSSGTWGIDGYNFCHISADGSEKRIPLCRLYQKMAYCPETQTRWGISQRTPGSIFVLDSVLQEIDCLRVRPDNTIPLIPQDIWYDEQTQLLYLVTKERLYRFNRNGDFLGMFLGAPSGTEYQAVCTFKNFMFVAAIKCGCLTLFSYTIDGIFLEQVSLGGGHPHCNLQVSVQSDGVRIYVFTTHDYRFPVLFEIAFEHEENIKNETDKKELGLFSVECVSETPELHSTCTVWGAG